MRCHRGMLISLTPTAVVRDRAGARLPRTVRWRRLFAGRSRYDAVFVPAPAALLCRYQPIDALSSSRVTCR